VNLPQPATRGGAGLRGWWEASTFHKENGSDSLHQPQCRYRVRILRTAILDERWVSEAVLGLQEDGFSVPGSWPFACRISHLSKNGRYNKEEVLALLRTSSYIRSAQIFSFPRPLRSTQ
jgi:hypothetical protein